MVAIGSVVSLETRRDRSLCYYSGKAWPSGVRVTHKRTPRTSLLPFLYYLFIRLLTINQHSVFNPLIRSFYSLICCVCERRSVCGHECPCLGAGSQHGSFGKRPVGGFLQRQGSVYKALSSGTQYLDSIIGSYETFIEGRNRYQAHGGSTTRGSKLRRDDNS